ARLGPFVIRYPLFVVGHSYAPWSRVRPASLDLSQRRLDPRRVERKIADTFASGVGEGIGNGGDRGALGAFTGAQRALVRAVDQLDLDLWHLRHGQDRIARPVARQDPAFVETHLLLQRPAHRLDDAAFDLAREPIRVDDQAGINRGPRLWHTDQAGGTVNHDLRHHRDIAGEILVFGKADAAAARTVALLSVLPAGLLGHSLDHGPRARVFQMCKAESDRIGAGRGRELIHEVFEREHVGIGAERAQ